MKSTHRNAQRRENIWRRHSCSISSSLSEQQINDLRHNKKVTFTESNFFLWCFLLTQGPRDFPFTPWTANSKATLTILLTLLLDKNKKINLKQTISVCLQHCNVVNVWPTIRNKNGQEPSSFPLNAHKYPFSDWKKLLQEFSDSHGGWRAPLQHPPCVWCTSLIGLIKTGPHCYFIPLCFVYDCYIYNGSYIRL